MSRKLRSSDRRLWGILTQMFYEHFLGIEFFNIHGSRVENRRSGFSLPVATDETFASSPQSGWAWLCFLFPLVGRVEVWRRVP